MNKFILLFLSIFSLGLFSLAIQADTTIPVPQGMTKIILTPKGAYTFRSSGPLQLKQVFMSLCFNGRSCPNPPNTNSIDIGGGYGVVPNLPNSDGTVTVPIPSSVPITSMVLITCQYQPSGTGSTWVVVDDCLKLVTVTFDE